MKNKVVTFIIGFLVGAIVASAGFLIFGGNKGKGSKGDFDPSKFNNGDMTTPSGFSRDKGDFDKSKIDSRKSDKSKTENNTQEQPAEQPAGQ